MRAMQGMKTGGGHVIYHIRNSAAAVQMWLNLCQLCIFLCIPRMPCGFW